MGIDERLHWPPSRSPESFSLDDEIASGALQFTSPGSGPITLQAWINEDLGRQLRETPLSSDMQLEPDEDGHRLTVTVQDSWQLRLVAAIAGRLHRRAGAGWAA